MISNTTALFTQLFAATIVGAIIGLEREKSKQNILQNPHITAPIGITTDILFSLFGAISMLLAQQFHFSVFLIGLGFVFTLLTIPYIQLIFTKTHANLKTEVSSLIVFCLGGLCIITPMIVPIVIAIITTLVLSIKDFLHKAAINISSNEIIDAIKFIIIAFVVLPFLPNTSYDSSLLEFITTITTLEVGSVGSLNILNPYSIWLIVVIISAISFLGYVLIRLVGTSKGIALTGLIGGFYSSTMTSLTLAHQSRNFPHIIHPYLAGITLACASSYIKMYVILHSLNRELFQRTFPAMSAMTIYLLIAGWVMTRRTIMIENIVTRKQKLDTATDEDSTSSEKNIYQQNSAASSHAQASDELKIELKSPFQLTSAIKFALILTATFVVANLILAFASLEWYYFLAGAMAFFAVDDPIIVSTAQIAGSSITLEVAKNIIIAVITLNMVQKVFTIAIFGNRKLIWRSAIIFGGLILVSILSLLYL